MGIFSSSGSLTPMAERDQPFFASPANFTLPASLIASKYRAIISRQGWAEKRPKFILLDFYALI
jgi:hypothetical protein